MTTHTKVSKRLTGLSVLSLVGAGCNIYLSHLYYELRSGTAAFKSLCNVSSTVNCDIVAASRWAEVAPGLPLSSIATGGMIAILLISLMARLELWQKASLRTLLWLTGAASTFGVFYFVVMAVFVKTWCLFCLITDAVSLSSLALVLSLKPNSSPTEKQDQSRFRNLISTSAVTVLVSVVLLKSFDELNIADNDVNDLVTSIQNTPPIAVNTGPGYPALGPTDAPITIVEFSDFQCPHCRHGAHVLNAVLSRYPKKIRLVFRAWPIDSACNREIKNVAHTAACEAARVARCSDQQGKFKEVYEAIFEGQDELAPGKAFEIAKAQGVDGAQLTTCLKNPAIADAVIKDVEEGIQLGITGTPVYYLNGLKIEGGVPLPVWTKLIDTFLSQANVK